MDEIEFKKFKYVEIQVTQQELVCNNERPGEDGVTISHDVRASFVQVSGKPPVMIAMCLTCREMEMQDAPAQTGPIL